MKIIFICGSMEPGKDGVGDYVRLLAGSLIGLGAGVAVFACSDKYVMEVTTGIQDANGQSISVLRLPKVLPANGMQAAADFIKAFNPDWFSLQFVPFSFDSKGLPFGLSKLLARLGKGRKWQIMFHELWVGMDTGSSLKHAAWGWLQKQLIKSLIRKLGPQIVHTQTALYKAYLNDCGINVQYLPLFGNIPPVGKAGEPARSEVIFVIFGNIHHGGYATSLAQEASAYSQVNKLAVKLQTVGRCGREEDVWINAWRKAGMEAEALGSQSALRISEILMSASFGISTTPWALIDKSGSVAAMLEHNLSVICAARDWQPRVQKNIASPVGVFRYKPGNLATLIAQRATVAPIGHHVTLVAAQLLKTFGNYGKF